MADELTALFPEEDELEFPQGTTEIAGRRHSAGLGLGTHNIRALFEVNGKKVTHIKRSIGKCCEKLTDVTATPPRSVYASVSLARPRITRMGMCVGVEYARACTAIPRTHRGTKKKGEGELFLV